MKGQGGISVLEMLIIVVVVCAVFGIGVPILHTGANTAVLDANVQSLGTLVDERIIEGYSPAYKASGEGDPTEHLSSSLEEALTEAGGAVYANPFVGRDYGTRVTNAHSLSLGPGFVAPAVLITDWSDCRYPAFSSIAPAVRQQLAGTLVVAFDEPSGTIDVYFVDSKGEGSPLCVSIPMSSVRTASSPPAPPKGVSVHPQG